MRYVHRINEKAFLCMVRHPVPLHCGAPFPCYVDFAVFVSPGFVGSICDDLLKLRAAMWDLGPAAWDWGNCLGFENRGGLDDVDLDDVDLNPSAVATNLSINRFW